MNANEVYPNIFVGAYPEPRDLKGFSLLSLHLPLASMHSPEIWWNMHPNLKVYFFPLTDDMWEIVKGDADRAARAAKLVARQAHDGGRVYVACREGMNRSGWVAAQAIMLLTGCSGKKALEIVKGERPGSLYSIQFARHLEYLPAGAPATYDDDWVAFANKVLAGAEPLRPPEAWGSMYREMAANATARDH